MAGSAAHRPAAAVCTTLSVCAFYITSQREIDRRGWMRTLKQAAAHDVARHRLCINQTRAVLEALFASESGRVRPHAQTRGARAAGALAEQEVPLGQDHRAGAGSRCALYFAVAMVMAMRNGHYLSMPFLLLFFVGYAYVGVLSVLQTR